MRVGDICPYPKLHNAINPQLPRIFLSWIACAEERKIWAQPDRRRAPQRSSRMRLSRMEWDGLSHLDWSFANQASDEAKYNGPQRAALYIRVSTGEQAEKGPNLFQTGYKFQRPKLKVLCSGIFFEPNVDSSHARISSRIMRKASRRSLSVPLALAGSPKPWCI